MRNNAVHAWEEVLGQENVLTEQPDLSRAETATFGTTHQIPVILRPARQEEVRACLRIANELNTPVYPTSTGKNWGLGSRVPTANGCALLDLSRMNRILDYNEEMAYVTIEPGVTCRQLYQFLKDKGSQLLVSLTGSTPDSSLVGNMLERGHAKGPYADRYSQICGVETVLPTGEILRSGFGRFPDSKAAAVTKWGVGPFLEGLFTQSNFGVVTQMTLWLMPAPSVFQTFFFSVHNPERLPEVLTALRKLKLSGLLKSSISLLNDYRVQSELGQYPWHLTDQKTPLTRHVLDTLKTVRPPFKAWSGQWNGESALYSLSHAQADAERKLIEEHLESAVDHLHFIKYDWSELQALITRVTDPDTGEIDRNQLSYQEGRLLGFIGVPMAGSIPITYWRKRIPTPTVDLDPDRDRCGIIWCSPTVPFHGDHAQVAIRLMTETYENHGFEPNLCLNAVTDRSIDITAAILFDREIPGEDEKAQACYDEMLKALCQAGYIPYRLTTQSMKSLPEAWDDSGKVITRLKEAMDPNAILSPGRYS